LGRERIVELLFASEEKSHSDGVVIEEYNDIDSSVECIEAKLRVTQGPSFTGVEHIMLVFIVIITKTSPSICVCNGCPRTSVSGWRAGGR